jgi:hypothetical protein
LREESLLNPPFLGKRGPEMLNAKFAHELATKALKAAQSGQKMKFNDPNELTQFVISILTIPLEVVPFGGAFAALTNLLAQIFFPLEPKDIWKGLLEQIEVLMDSKIAEAEIDRLQQKLRGIEHNMDLTSTANF